METPTEQLAARSDVPHVVPGDSAHEDVRCPLCDYDLRGLTEARCPECGYRFEWSDLTDPARELHPYLFEHHPRRNLRSFVRTMLGGLWPRRFWASLKPSQPSRPGRLIVYWLVSALLLPAAYAAVFAQRAASFLDDHENDRKRMLASVNTYFATYGYDPSPNSFTEQVAKAGGARQWVDSIRPPANTLAYLGYVHRQDFAPLADEYVASMTLLFAWPWLTLATLMVFRASMRRAKVNASHVLRCALYSCDASLPLGLIAFFALPPAVHRLDLGRYIGYRETAVAALVFGTFTTWRLAAAYRHYLRFDRPVATAAAAQAIVVLVAWVCLYAGGA